ncbi:MAG: MFS transporter [Acidimicrobiia bacterium]|nr:MFS transporter [Acidimicrobiia bacterium]
MEIGRSELAKLTFGKGTINTAIRWLPFFLPTLAIAYDSSTATLALLLGIAEASGLSTYFVGRWLDAGRERLVIVLALGGVVLSSALALVGSIWFFAAAAVVIGVAAGNVTVAGHAWISARVPFNRRARFIGVYEFSWAGALLIGVPLVAMLISVFGWRGPFIAVAIVAIISAAFVATIDDGEGARRDMAPSDKTPITTDAWFIIAAGAMVAMAGLTTIVIAGTWLDEALGVSTGGVGLVAMAFGAAELIASMSSAAFADRLGKRRSVQFSVSGLLVGLAIIAITGSSLLIGTIGLFIFFVGFEYAIVTSFSLVSEAMPDSRGKALGVGNALGTLARGVGVALAGLLYENFDVHGPLALSAAAAICTLVLLSVVAHRRPDLT